MIPNFFPFISYVFVTTFTPGPNNIMSMALANRFGYRKTLNFTLGVAVGFAVTLLLSSFFNLFIFNLLPQIKQYIGILGALYMSYLAVKIMTSKPSSEDKKKTRLNSFLTGFLLQFINPKAIMYGITVTSGFILPYFNSYPHIVLFSLLLASIGFISVSCWALFGAAFQKFLAKYRRPFNIIMGLLLLYSALSVSGLL